MGFRWWASQSEDLNLLECKGWDSESERLGAVRGPTLAHGPSAPRCNGELKSREPATELCYWSPSSSEVHATHPFRVTVASW